MKPTLPTPFSISPCSRFKPPAIQRRGARGTDDRTDAETISASGARLPASKTFPASHTSAKRRLKRQPEAASTRQGRDLLSPDVTRGNSSGLGMVFSVPGSTKQLDLFLSRSNARECFILSSSPLPLLLSLLFPHPPPHSLPPLSDRSRAARAPEAFFQHYDTVVFFLLPFALFFLCVTLTLVLSSSFSVDDFRSSF